VKRTVRNGRIGEQAMIESPMLDQLIEEEVAKRLPKKLANSFRQAILRILDNRFGPVSANLSTALSTFTHEKCLEELVMSAVTSPNLESFCRDLSASEPNGCVETNGIASDKRSTPLPVADATVMVISQAS
jgi:hypothetical protein